MKGRELCEQFFREVGFPAIEKELPECIPFIAVGMFGGSQCHGNDDEISRDHSWGPGFGIWLTSDPYQRFATDLQDILDRMPQEYQGFGWGKPVERACGVEELSEYVLSVVGVPAAPQVAEDWLHIPEEYLFEITHRPVFLDSTGETTEKFRSFQKYPEDVWRKRLSACLAWLGEWGIKHLARAEARGDLLLSLMYWSRFSIYAMKVGFLLARQFAPYHKWLAKEFSRLPETGFHCVSLIEQGYVPSNQRSEIALQIVEYYQKQLSTLGYEPVRLSAEQQAKQAYPNLVHQYARAIHESIENSTLRKMRIFVEVLIPPTRPTWMAVF